MNLLFEAAAEIQRTIMNHKWPFCFIGGLAVLRWGEIRMTRDIDLCLSCGFGNEKRFSTALLDAYTGRIKDSLEFAMENRVLLLQASNEVAVDISLSGLPFEERMIRRATSFSFSPGCSLVTCSAEDLIVLKAFAGRHKDWNDIEGVALRQGADLDTDAITRRLTPLCEATESTETLDRLKTLFVYTE
jgi:hypothetical protein